MKYTTRIITLSLASVLLINTLQSMELSMTALSDDPSIIMPIDLGQPSTKERLRTAIREGKEQDVERMLSSRKFNLGRNDLKDLTICAAKGDSLEYVRIVNLLLGKAEDPVVRKALATKALTTASIAQNPNIVKLALREGANVEGDPLSEYTPFLLALRNFTPSKSTPFFSDKNEEPLLIFLCAGQLLPGIHALREQGISPLRATVEMLALHKAKIPGKKEMKQARVQKELIEWVNKHRKELQSGSKIEARRSAKKKAMWGNIPITLA